MSFDLYFRKRSGGFDENAFLDFFRTRPFYRVESRQAIYGNEDTGVYFVIELNESADNGHDAAFSLNYLRPSFFVREAEPEVTALVRHFDFVVTDPQIDGMGEDRYDEGGLIDSWMRSNVISVRAVLEKPSEQKTLPTLPTDRLIDIWRWNLGRKALQASLGENVFVPRIFFVRADGRVQTIFAWTDGIPTLLPRTDLVLVFRKELAPWRLFWQQPPDQALLSWADTEALVSPHVTPHTSGALLLFYKRRPKAIAAKLDGLTPDLVLDRELVDKALAMQK
ncbi:MAG: hypothetical protein JOY81_09160 [Alphaproteobacteria bacterium]|nr:hypothetical protein [Alphaproteobacteria bacterium]